MRRFLSDYSAAESAARRTAIECACDVGLERTAEYGTAGFSVFLLPRPDKRFGHELRAQVVTLTESIALELARAEADATALAREYDTAIHSRRMAIEVELDRAQAWIALCRSRAAITRGVPNA